MKKYQDCLIVLKSGIIKGYNFSDKFIKENNILFEELENIWNEFYQNNCCVWGASNTHKHNDNLKFKLCNTLDKLFDLGVTIMNGWDDIIYKNKKDYRKYILEYWKEV